LNSSSREKDGDSRTTGPVNSPAAAISMATFAPRLWPTTMSQPSPEAGRPMIPA